MAGNKKVIIGVAVLVAVLIFAWAFAHKSTVPGQQTDNTPYPLPTRTEDLQTKVGETTRGNTEVAITPLQIIEDSRCPAGVYCIQAGRLIVNARVAENDGGKEYKFTLGEKVDTDYGVITMTGSQPLKKIGVEIKPQDYTFTFHVVR